MHAVLAAAAWAQMPIPDKEFKLIDPPQKPANPKKIEVIEFFSYACPHCADFEAPLQAWLKRKPKDVEYKAVPVVFREQWKPLAKLFYTLETMGVLDKYHVKVFDALHKQGAENDCVGRCARDAQDKSWDESTPNGRVVGSLGCNDPIRFALSEAFGMLGSASRFGIRHKTSDRSTGTRQDAN